MPRFFLEKMNPELPVITGGDARHIGFSLRMKPGERLTVCSEGVDYRCAVKRITEDAVFLDILEHTPCAAEIVPVLTRRCVSRPSEKDFSKKLERLNKIAMGAAKQSGRGIVPRVMPLIGFKKAVAEMSESECPVMLYEEGGIRFSELKVLGKSNFSLFIGSEGGFDAEEADYARRAGINAVWLGNRILRCETAPVTAISILMYITKNL